MNVNPELALAKQALTELLALCDPERVTDWRPSPTQRDQYLRLADAVLTGYGQLRWLEHGRLHSETKIHSVVPESALAFLRDQLKPRLPTIRAAINALDPEGAEVLNALYDAYTGGHSADAPYIRWGIDESLDALEHMLRLHPEDEDGHELAVVRIREFMDSDLVDFKPDAWMERSQQLTPIRSSKANFELPLQMRMRLQEVYRAYVFGLWLSVLALSRGILEYAILDNAAKFRIDPKWPPDRSGKRTGKKLFDLIDELGQQLPAQMQSMHALRALGNGYIHPTKADTSRALMFRCETNARAALPMLVDVLQAIYSSRGSPEQSPVGGT